MPAGSVNTSHRVLHQMGSSIARMAAKLRLLPILTFVAGRILLYWRLIPHPLSHVKWMKTWWVGKSSIHTSMVCCPCQRLLPFISSCARKMDCSSCPAMWTYNKRIEFAHRAPDLQRATFFARGSFAAFSENGLDTYA
jgi:hypothetical protein